MLRARETADVITDGLDLPALQIDRRLNEIGADGDESLTRGVARVGALLNELASKHAGEVVIAVTHAGVIVTSLLALLEIPLESERAWLEPHFLSMTRWLYENDRWTLESYNVTLESAHDARSPS